MLISFFSPGRPVGQHGSVFSAVGLFIQTHKRLNHITNKNRSKSRLQWEWWIFRAVDLNVCICGSFVEIKIKECFSELS